MGHTAVSASDPIDDASVRNQNFTVTRFTN